LCLVNESRGILLNISCASKCRIADLNDFYMVSKYADWLYAFNENKFPVDKLYANIF